MHIKSNKRNLCVKLRWKAVKQYFVKICRSGIMSNKNFWKTVKLFTSNKTNRNESDVILVESSNIFKNRKNVADILNQYFINIAEYAADRQISTLPWVKILKYPFQKSKTDMKITYTAVSIQNIKNRKLNSTFAFEKTTSSNIRQLIFDLNARKLELIPFQWKLHV